MNMRIQTTNESQEPPLNGHSPELCCLCFVVLALVSCLSLDEENWNSNQTRWSTSSVLKDAIPNEEYFRRH